jgi:DNA-binding NarL/FixJ family response regulator
MQPPGPVWVDERNPIYRRGLVTCLLSAGYGVAGESVALRPTPDIARSALLIFDIDAAGVEEASALARHYDLLLMGLVRGTAGDRIRELLANGMSAALPLRTLTPARLLSCVQALKDKTGARKAGRAKPLMESALGPPQGEGNLSRRELAVLSLLADGDSTSEIAHHLSYSERTVKNIVHDVRAKLDGRTRAHAVAVAARRGLI